MTPIDPAAVEAELLEAAEIADRPKTTYASEAALKKLIATCRALLAELALSRAAVEVCQAIDAREEAVINAEYEAACKARDDYTAALFQWRKLKNGCTICGSTKHNANFHRPTNVAKPEEPK